MVIGIMGGGEVLLVLAILAGTEVLSTEPTCLEQTSRANVTPPQGRDPKHPDSPCDHTYTAIGRKVGARSRAHADKVV